MGVLGQDLQYSHTNRGRHEDETEAHCHVEARLEGDDSCAERPHTRDGVCSMKGFWGKRTDVGTDHVATRRVYSRQQWTDQRRN